MLLIQGIHHFGRRKTAARKDFCNACERECLAERWRAFDCWHLFWLPLVPLGSRERWLCSLCNQDPRKCYTTSLGFKILGLLVLAVLEVTMFTVDLEPTETSTLWIARIVFALAFLGVLYSILRPPIALPEDERRSRVVPLNALQCVYCRGPLQSQPHLHCPSCQVQIFAGEHGDPQERYRALVEKMGDVGLFTATPEPGLAGLSELRLPETVLAFYRHFAPANVIENSQSIRLLSVPGIIEANRKTSVGQFTAPHGYVEFASTFSGDIYCFDIRTVNASGEPRIVLFSHEAISEETTAEELAKLAKPIAGDLADFLEKFKAGDLDEAALDYGDVDL